MKPRPRWQFNFFLCKHFRWVYVTHFVKRNLGQRSENYTFPPLIYAAESSVGLGRIEEDTQNADKLQLSVRTKNRTNFVKTCRRGF